MFRSIVSKAAADHFQVLGVSRTCNDDEVKKAYLKLAKEWHPDVNKAPEASDKFKVISDAYDNLKDEVRRSHYRAELQYGRTPGHTADTNVPWVYDWKYLSSKINKISFEAMVTGKVAQNKGALKDILPALPELLKLLAEVTYEFLLHGEEYLAVSSQLSRVDAEMPSTFSLVSELDVARVSLIPQVIAILSVIVHPSHRHIVDHMSFEFAQRYSTVGVD
eukprot:gene5440-3879_t